MAMEKLARHQRLGSIQPETLFENANLLDAQRVEFEDHGGHVADDDAIPDEPTRAEGALPPALPDEDYVLRILL